MKKVFLLVVCALSMQLAHAQYKGSVGKAESNLAKGELQDAKGEIDEAIKDEKDAGKSRTWFTRGKIYQAIATSDNATVSALDDQAIEKATEAYQKTKALENEGSPTYYLAEQNIDDLWGSFINVGGDAYSTEDFATAYDQFMIALRVKPSDSLTTYYAAAAAQQQGEFENALARYYEMIENGDGSNDVLSTVAYLERAEMKNDEKALEVVQMARELYPDDDKFAKEEINLLIALEQVDEARAKLESEIDKDPENVSLRLNLGIMYDNLGTALVGEGKLDEGREAYKKAIAAYTKATEIEPNDFVGLYNNGAVYVNLGKIYLDEARDMDLKVYQKEGPALIEKAQVELKQGLPFLERAAEVEPEDADVLRALYQVYQQLKMNDKANETYSKIEALEGGH
jgi:tetratricopeptide (TPR) repeat protein